MNLDKLFSWIAGVVIAFAIMGKLDVLQAWIWRAQATVIYASRTSTWGSPRFFPATQKTPALAEQNVKQQDPLQKRLTNMKFEKGFTKN